MESYITKKGLEKLKKELAELKITKANLSKEIGEAAQQGDLKENAGYHFAREKMSETLRRIGELENKIVGAKITDDLKLSKDEVLIGATVTVKDSEDGEEYTYTLVGAEEADPANWKISVHAPISQALLGHKVGETVKAQLPAGLKEFKILKIERE